MNKSYRAYLAIAVLATAGSVNAAPNCFPAFGTYKQVRIEGNSCNSPLEQCSIVNFKGTMNGTALNAVTRVAGTPDFPISGVLGGTSDGEFEGRVRNRRGGVTFKYAALIDSIGRGDAVALLTIIEGSGELTGVTGTLRFSTVFDLTAAETSTTYEGQICLP